MMIMGRQNTWNIQKCVEGILVEQKIQLQSFLQM